MTPLEQDLAYVIGLVERIQLARIYRAARDAGASMQQAWACSHGLRIPGEVRR